MILEHFTLNYLSSHISCHRFGHGSRTVICFPGYGETGKAYSLLAGEATSAFSFFCVDLPFHGGTGWKEQRPFLPADLLAVRDLLIARQNVQETGYYLMGFSLGGRVALQLYHADPSRVLRLLLLAPDGLRSGFWFSFSGTWIGNRIFRILLLQSRLLPPLLYIIGKTGLVDKSRLKFVDNYLRDGESRRLVYRRWTALGKMRTRRSEIRRLILDQHTITRLLYGRFDRVITAADGAKFNASIQPYGKLAVMDCGHQLLLPKNKKTIIAALTD